MTTNIHLLVLIHGMWGHPGHLSELNRIIREKHGELDADGVQLDVLLAETNRDDATYDGIDWGGERVAEEVQTRLKKLAEDDKKVVKFSVTGYSLGGLVARYMIGILHQRGFFKDVQPVNFNTIATPHLGLLKYPSIFSSLAGMLGPKLLSKTGEQFYCVDKWSKTGRPLIEVMADPDWIFHEALSMFAHLRIYANAVNDVTVPYCTAAIETKDPFVEYEINGIQIETKEEYVYVIDSYTMPDTPPPKPACLSSEWFDSLKPKPILPPALQFRFPFNVALYSMLPFLIPVATSYVVYRFSVSSRNSRARIKSLERDEAYREKLVAIFQELETEVENTIADVVDDDEASAYPIIKEKLHPNVTSSQKKMAKWLNQLPIKKELAFFPRVRNSHAMIVCRDVKRFEGHRLGESIIRHWADSFVL